MGLWSGHTIPTLEKNPGWSKTLTIFNYNEGLYVCFLIASSEPFPDCASNMSHYNNHVRIPVDLGW